MTQFQNDLAGHRFTQDIADAGGVLRRVRADYRLRDGVYELLHVEADPALRGTGAAGRFMQTLSDHARAEGLKLAPHCGYAVAWFKRHPDEGDLLAA
ncbi:GNAT family N-acetyltransferase [uncultured Brevundimonas sp.]|uniref:GNAT family N-acetyltransferase n=1 Tax=uncultured Brevundimonas sp. TaxID=213418 RepID=UPI0030EB7840